MNVDTLQHGRNQPFYHVLPDTRDRPGAQLTYVAQACVCVGVWEYGAWTVHCMCMRTACTPHAHSTHITRTLLPIHPPLNPRGAGEHPDRRAVGAGAAPDGRRDVRRLRPGEGALRAERAAARPVPGTDARMTRGAAVL